MQGKYIHNDISTECIKKEMGVNSIDVIKSYTTSSREMKIAISVQNYCGFPVHKGKVEIALMRPDGSKYTLSQITDKEGIALFELGKIDQGRWEVVVFEINHPHYTLNHKLSSQKWYMTDV
jgi:hypothetical protein